MFIKEGIMARDTEKFGR